MFTFTDLSCYIVFNTSLSKVFCNFCNSPHSVHPHLSAGGRGKWLNHLPNFQKGRALQDLSFEKGIAGKERLTFFTGGCNFTKKINWNLKYLMTKKVYKQKYFWLYLFVMLRKHFRVNPHSVVVWMSRNFLLETGAKSEV